MVLNQIFGYLSLDIKDFLITAVTVWIIEIAVILVYYEIFPRLLLLRKDWKVKEMDAHDLLSPFEKEIKIKSVYVISPVAVKVIRLSKKTIFTREEVIRRKMNALATGLFKKYIFITEDAFSKLEESELRAILAHEVGHHLRRHLLKGCTLTIVYFLLLVPFSNLVRYVLAGVDLNQLIVGYCLGGLYGFLYFLIVAKMWRRFERQADAYAKEKGYGPHLATALQKMAEYNKIPMDSGIILKLFGFHPSIASRIKALTDKEVDGK